MARPPFLFICLLFNRDTLGEVSGLIHIATPEDGDVICQQLQGQNGENRAEQPDERA